MDTDLCLLLQYVYHSGHKLVTRTYILVQWEVHHNEVFYSDSLVFISLALVQSRSAFSPVSISQVVPISVDLGSIFLS